MLSSIFASDVTISRSFEINFHQDQELRIPVTYLDVPRQHYGEVAEILSVNPSEIIFDTLKALRYAIEDADNEQGSSTRRHKLDLVDGWKIVFLFDRLIRICHARFKLPEPLAFHRLRLELSSIVEPREARKLLHFLQRQVPKSERSEKGYVCGALVAYFEDVRLTESSPSLTLTSLTDDRVA